MPIIQKTPAQIQGIKKSCQLAAKCLEWIEPHVQAGAKTADLDDMLHGFIRDNGAIPAPLGYNGFPKATCISINEVICHGIPSNRRLEEGDILNIDVTTILDGYYGDTSKMYMVGEITEAAAHLCAISRACLWLGIGEVKPGAHIGNIGAIIQELAESAGYSSAYQFCGHGVGLDFHEDPQVPHVGVRGDGPQMQPGMIFTIEPMICQGTGEALINEADGWTAITADRKLSAQYEHTVLVTDDGCEVLTLLED